MLGYRAMITVNIASVIAKSPRLGLQKMLQCKVCDKKDGLTENVFSFFKKAFAIFGY
jgi:hypothetical protein